MTEDGDLLLNIFDLILCTLEVDDLDGDRPSSAFIETLVDFTKATLADSILTNVKLLWIGLFLLLMLMMMIDRWLVMMMMMMMIIGESRTFDRYDRRSPWVRIGRSAGGGDGEIGVSEKE